MGSEMWIRDSVLVDFGPATGLWVRRNDSAWEAVHGVAPQQMAAGDLDNNGRSDVLIDFGSPYGIWAWRNGASWSAVHGSSSTQIVATDLDLSLIHISEPTRPY